MSKATTAVPIVFGAMTFGAEGKEQARVHDVETCNKILDIFQAHGHDEVDTARVYGAGTCEGYLRQCGTEKRGIKMDTKLFPNKNSAINLPGLDVISHMPEDLRKQLKKSLEELGLKKLHMWYLHAPDRFTPYEETLRGVNDLYKEGYFEYFGISNYQSWEVAQLCEICERNGWVKPIVYQGVYNALHRAVEPELFPCLRKYGMGFYAFNPLAGGFFTEKFASDLQSTEVEKGSRYDPDRLQGRLYRMRYWNDEYFSALKLIKPVAEKNGLTLAETALRWMMHHSQLGREYMDTAIIGASSTDHIEANLKDFEKGPLPQEMVDILDQGWAVVRGISNKYWH